jgi:SAM-dependent methyltransferase
MNIIGHNRRAWDAQSAAMGIWSRPVNSDIIARARRGDWQVILTPRLPVPRDWFGDISGKRVLCLASGGGQQVPVLAAAGAEIVSFDLSDEQLAKDADVCAREGLSIRCLQGDMADLSILVDGAFDLIFHPVSNVFVPDIEPVWRECFRVLAPGGRLLAGFMNPTLFLFDHEEADKNGILTVNYHLPYADAKNLSPQALQHKLAENRPLEYSHSMETQIGGQLRAGFVLTGFYEDHWFDESWVFSRHSPVSFATRAARPA